MTYRNRVSKTRYNIFLFQIKLEDMIVDFLFFMNNILCKEFVKKVFNGLLKNFWNIFFFLLFVVPPFLCYIYDWEVPGIYIFYALIMGLRYLYLFAEMMEKSRFSGHSPGYRSYGYEGFEDFEGGYKKSGTIYKPTNPYRFEPFGSEKLKNGGLTDKEVIDRKKLIRKKLTC